MSCYFLFNLEIIRQDYKKNGSIIINADGVYVATIMSLYVNLKLINQNYYDDSSILPIMSEVSLRQIYFTILISMLVEFPTVKTLIN